MTWLHNLTAGLALALEPLRFRKHAEERRYAAEAANRDAQLRLIESVLTAQDSTNARNAEALMEVAKTVQGQAAGFQEWLKLFASNGEPVSSTVTVGDEVELERARVAQELSERYPTLADARDQLDFLLNRKDETD
jgi:uncharacterized damage-inducible protein DinB